MFSFLQKKVKYIVQVVYGNNIFLNQDAFLSDLCTYSRCTKVKLMIMDRCGLMGLLRGFSIEEGGRKARLAGLARAVAAAT